MACQIVILAIVLFVALWDLASAAVNPAPKVAPEDTTAAPLTAEKGDDNSIGDGEDGKAAPGMAEEAPDESKSSGAAAIDVSATAGLISTTLVFGLLCCFC